MKTSSGLIAFVGVLCGSLLLNPTNVTAGVPGSLLWTLDVVSFGNPALGPEGQLYTLVNSEGAISLLALTEGKQTAWKAPLIQQPPNFSPFGNDFLTIGPTGEIYCTIANHLFALDSTGRLLFEHSQNGALDILPTCITAEGNLLLALRMETLGTDLKWLRRDGTTISSRSLPYPFSDGLVLDGDGSFYLTVSGNRPPYSGSYVVALDSAGAERWIYSARVTWAYSLALGLDGDVYAATTYGNHELPLSLACLDANTTNPYGQRKWRLSSHTFELIDGAVCIGPNGIAYFLAGESTVAAVDRNGVLLWEFQARGRLTPGAMAIGRDRTIYFSSTEEFYAVDQTGQLRWRRTLGGYGTTSPVISKSGAIFFVTPGPLSPRLWAIDTGLTSPVHPWPMSRGDLRRSGRSPIMEPPKGFSRNRLLPDGSLELIIEGPPLKTYGIERSSDLKRWIPASTVASSNGAVRLVVSPTPDGSNAFYRLAKP